MKAKRLSLILIVTVLSIAGCGTSENASSNLLPETEENGGRCKNLGRVRRIIGLRAVQGTNQAIANFYEMCYS